MKLRLRKISAAAMVLILMLLTACGSDKPDYAALKTDIIGMWCDVDGPEYVGTEESGYYRLYEFTSDRIVYHMMQTAGYDAYYDDSEYEIRDDLLDVGGAMCRISIENDVLTMSYDSGKSMYRRMDIPEVCSYGIYYIGGEMLEKQQEYLASVMDEAGGQEAVPKTVNIETSNITAE